MRSERGNDVMTAMSPNFRPTSANDLQRRPRTLVLALAFLALGLGCGGSDDGGDGNPITPSNTQVLTVGNTEGAPGDTTTIVLSLQNTEPLSGLQFDLLHDPGVLTVVEALTTGRTAGFEVFHSAPAAGTARVLLTDLSGTAQLAQGNGSVVTLRVAIDTNAPLGTSTISTAHAVGTDQSATPVSLGSANATLTIH
jgi:cohesin domain-containing protein